MKKYKLKYSVEMKEDGYSAEDVLNDDEGLCDSIVIMSTIHHENGMYDQLNIGFDGRQRKPFSDIDDNDTALFKAWMILGFDLRDRQNLTGFKRDLVEFVCEKMREMVKITIRNHKD